MLILGALILGVLLCYLALGVFTLALWSDEGRGLVYLVSALFGLPGLFLIGWFIYQVITLS